VCSSEGGSVTSHADETLNMRRDRDVPTASGIHIRCAGTRQCGTEHVADHAIASVWVTAIHQYAQYGGGHTASLVMAETRARTWSSAVAWVTVRCISLGCGHQSWGLPLQERRVTTSNVPTDRFRPITAGGTSEAATWAQSGHLSQTGRTTARSRMTGRPGSF
jgi:hypothetical protein